ncbi:MAG: hypothetical protein V7749_08425 [Cocleimonas sp.]
MSRSGGMSQLLKGIIIGVLLIIAIIGTMRLLDKDGSLSSLSTNNTTQITTQDSVDIVAPSITLNPDSSEKAQNANNTQNNSNIGDLNAKIPEETIIAKFEVNENTIDESTTNVINTENTVQPVLEDERTPEEATNKDLNTITFGMMELNAINPNNKQALKVGYSVFDQNNVKVAESTNASNASYRLPIGQYKVETTLTRIDDATNQVIPVLTKSRYIIVRKNSTAKQTFELEPPTTTGVLQVSAKMNDQIIRANFVIQKANGEVVASRDNVTSSLFKLNTGTYKVTVSSGNNKDFKSVEVKAGESLQTVFTLKQAAQQGKLLVRVFDTRSSNPVRADISITNANGTVIQDIKASTQTELSLAAGDYKIRVIGPNGTSNKNIRVNPGQEINEIFRFDAPNINTASGDNSQNNTTQITDTVTIKPVENQPETPLVPENTDSNKVTLSVIAQDEQTRKSMKSNIYIQTPAGKHLDKRTYVDSASFSLTPGVYKVTVRANNRNNVVKTIRITENENVSEIFLLVNPNKSLNQASPSTSVSTAVELAKPVNTPTAIATGFLNVSMQAPNNQRVNKSALNTHFIVSTTAGKKIVELTSVTVGNFKLDVGSYVVTAVHNNKRRSQRINIKQNQNTRLAFNTSDFQATKGILRSRIVDQSGRPLKGDLIVSSMSGQVVARANNVSSAVFDLSPTRHSISVNYQGLSGNEVVNINANETTIQTFTIAPNRNPPSNNTNQARDIRDILKEKLKKEIQRQL